MHPWTSGPLPAPPSTLVSSLGQGKTGLLFLETRAAARPRPGPYTGPFVCPLAWGAWPHGAAYPGHVHQQLQGLAISGLHRAEEAGRVFQGPVTDAALGRQAGEAGPRQHPRMLATPPAHSHSAHRTALPSCGCSEPRSPRWLPRSWPHPPEQFGWIGVPRGLGRSDGASAAEAEIGELELSWAGWDSPRPTHPPSSTVRFPTPPPLWSSCHCFEPWLQWRAGRCWPSLPLPTVCGPGQVPRGAHLGGTVSEAKKPASHGPSSGQCQQQQARGSAAPRARLGLHLGAHCSPWGLKQRPGSRLAQEGRG